MSNYVDYDNAVELFTEVGNKRKASESMQESLLKSTVGWTGKNKLHSPSSVVSTGIFTVNRNAEGELINVDVSGDGGEGTNLQLTPNANISDGNYILSGCPSGGSSSTYRLVAGIYSKTDNSYIRVVFDFGEGGAINLASNEYIREVYIRISGSVTKTFTPMLRDASITDDTYEPYHESVEEVVEQIYADNGVLGAKNLLVNERGNSTIEGVTFVVNADGTVTVSGTPSNNNAFYDFYNPIRSIGKIPAGRYILSGTPSGIDTTKYNMYVEIGGTGKNSYDLGNGVTFDYNGTDTLRFVIGIRTSAVSNLTFKPMLRLASDPDDTYVPYAMTNRELTEDRYYHAGDTVNVSLMNFSALITNSSKEIRFTIPLMKDLSKITGITFKNTTTVGIRKPGGGYVIDGIISSGYNITILAKSGNLLSIKLTKTDDSAFDATNNTPLDVAFTGGSNDSVITFS